jgi:serine/threonine protein kinase
LLDKKYGRAVDWWAFGVLIYQMLLQQSPFRGDDEDEIYDAILADEPLYPIHMPRDSVSILQKLLTREPEHRLGSGPTDAQEIMSHAFFRNINWDDVYHKRIPAPFMPQITSATDTSNFDQEFTSVTPVLTPVQSGKSSANADVREPRLLTPTQYSLKPCKRSSAASPILPTSPERRDRTLVWECLCFLISHLILWRIRSFLSAISSMGEKQAISNHVSIPASSRSLSARIM